MTKRDSFPLPRIDTTLDSLRGSPVFSTLDLASGYWQVELKHEDKHKTAFAIPSGLYEFQTMPFGLSNAPATFQRMMNKILVGLVPQKCLVYLDDIIVHGSDLEAHLENLRSVFDRIKDAGLTLSPTKCKLLRDSVDFLGYRVTPSGIITSDDKVKSIVEWPTPRSATEVRSFLGLASYYRRFVAGYAKVASPLHKLTHSQNKFRWTNEAEQAFKVLKQKLCSTPILAYPDVREDSGIFILDTDASNEGIGAVLSQIQPDGSERVISYASRALSPEEKKYCVTRKELLAVICFSQKFQPYLIGRRFQLRTDHQSLKWLLNFKDPSNQLARWQQEIQILDYEFVHRPGVKHGNADGLSRRPHQGHGDCPSCQSLQAAAVRIQPEQTEMWAHEQSIDPNISIIYNRLITGSPKPTGREMAGLSYEAKSLWSLWDKLRLENNVLIFQYQPDLSKRLVLPISLVNQTLVALHSELGHAGQGKMVAAARQRYWWPHQQRDVVNFCTRCDTCASFKCQRYNRAPLTNITTGFPNEIVGVDIIGPLPISDVGNRYILVMVDLFTKWCEAVPLVEMDAVTVANAIFREWIARWGAPLQLHSDQGANFESNVVQSLCDMFGIKKLVHLVTIRKAMDRSKERIVL